MNTWFSSSLFNSGQGATAELLATFQILRRLATRLTCWVAVGVVMQSFNGVAAPGTVSFANHNGTKIINGQTGEPITSARAALYWSPLGTSSFVQIGEIAEVGWPVAGVFVGGTRTCGAATAGGMAGQFQVRAWTGDLGTFEQAIATPGVLIGQSAVIQVSTSDPVGDPPLAPASLFSGGLQGFSLLMNVDSTPPEITCPSDVTVNADAGQCFAGGLGLGTPTASDNFGTVTVSNNAAALFPVGTNVVTWTAADPSGNTNTCAQLVIVRDVTPPAITASPQSRTNNVGTTASFSVSATACSPSSCQWFFGAAQLDGETNTTLNLPNVQWASGGIYTVVVTSRGGSATRSATLTVNRLPVANSNAAGTSLAQSLTIPVIKLIANDSDPDGDALSITGVNTPSALGASVSLAADLITYVAPVSGTSDSFTYTVSDGRGGTALGTVNVTLSGGSGLGFNQLTPDLLPGGDLKLNFLGIPGLRYALERTHDLDAPEWLPLMTNQVGANGWLFFTNRPSAPGPDFYRTRHVP